MPEFKSLIADLDTMQKALAEDAADDKKIEMAAAESGNKPEGEEVEEGADTTAPMLKSLTIKHADGTEEPAFDGAEMVKSLIEEITSLKDVVIAQSGVIAKMNEDRVSQRTMMKSLQATVEGFGNQRAGRRTTLVVSEKQPAVATGAAAPAGMTVGELMVKGLAACSEGKITGDEASYFESRITRPEPMKDPQFASIVNRINAATAA